MQVLAPAGKSSTGERRSPVRVPRIVGVVSVALTLTALAEAPWGAATVAAQGRPRPVVRTATRSDTSRPVRDLPERPPTPPILGEIFQRPFKVLPNRQGSPEVDVFDEALQGPIAGPGAPSVTGSFDGVNNVNGVLPPDPTGAVGPNHYVQMVNLSFAVYDRVGNILYGPVDNSTLWTGLGGACETSNDGDPIVLYDHLADRWMLSQFALPNFPSGPFYQCFAVSQTPDPTGAWHRYEFLMSESLLQDYPKFGLWPDGYYMASNQFLCFFGGCFFWGQAVVAFERDAMLAGAPARGIYFDLGLAAPNLGGMLPADLDGPPPPAGAPVPYAQVDDDAWGYSPDQLQIWELAVNWAAPLSSTFTPAVDLPTASFNSNMCDHARNCIPQPGGTAVDAISDRLMYRLQYRNFGSHQSLVTNHTVDATGSDHAGIRWYELRSTGGGWSIFQQGTYAPDADHRWMGSVAMNGVGDIAVGYSKASTSVYPSVVVTGRLDGDATGFLTQPEVTLAQGSGVQTHSSGRWGDYSQMTVDPRDDCTFWYTQEYYAETGLAPWRTRIGSVRLRDCGPVGDGAPTVSLDSPPNGATVSGTVLVTASAADDVAVTRVEFYLDGALQASDEAAPYAWSWNTTTTINGNHGLQAHAYDAAGSVGTSDVVAVTVDNSVAAGIVLTASGYKGKGLQKANLAWSGATSPGVDVYRDGALIATTVNDGAHVDDIDDRGKGSYTYQVCEAGTSTCSNAADVSF